MIDGKYIKGGKGEEDEERNAEISKSEQTNRTADHTYFQSQIFTKLSHPPVTNRRLAPGSGLVLTKLPGAAAGAQLTELTPNPCAKNI